MYLASFLKPARQLSPYCIFIDAVSLSPHLIVYIWFFFLFTVQPASFANVLTLRVEALMSTAHFIIVCTKHFLT